MKKQRTVTVSFEGKDYVLKKGDTLNIWPELHLREGNINPVTVKAKTAMPVKVVSID